jgi:hypothetical protein
MLFHIIVLAGCAQTTQTAAPNYHGRTAYGAAVATAPAPAATIQADHVLPMTGEPGTLDTPVAGARPPSSTATNTPGPRAYDSDNRPNSVRSGLNSDPDNPSGARPGFTR